MSEHEEDFKDVSSIRPKNFLEAEQLARMGAFHEKYKGLVEKIATAFKNASLGHSHYCTNGIYMSDGPDMDWTVEHPDDYTIRTMVGGINGDDPLPAEIGYREGRDDEYSACVTTGNFFDAMFQSQRKLEEFLRGVSNKPDAELSATDKQTFAGLKALRKLLTDGEFRAGFLELTALIAAAAKKSNGEFDEATAFNERLAAQKKNRRFNDLVDQTPL